MRRTTWLVAAIALVGAACTGTSDSASTTTLAETTVPPETTPATTTTQAPEVELRVDRLAVIDSSGRVVTIDRDGSEPVVLAEADELPFQPIWSPDAARIAYSSRIGDASFVVAAEDGSDARRVETPTPIFYSYWSPDGARLATLRNGATGIQFEFVEVGDDALSLMGIDTGQPYYFAWNPDGTATVAHVGFDRLDTVGIDGAIDPLPSRPTEYRAPAWTASGIVTAAEGPNGQELVLIDPAGETEAIARIEGGAVFGANPAGTLLAVETFADAGEGNGVEAAMQLDEPLTPNRLYVIDLETGDAIIVAREPAFAFFWSPVGDDLLLLTITDGAGTMQWRVWDGDALVDGPTFQPARGFVAEFLPFFDQYALSMSLWAPDGSAYAFPGNIDGEGGIWVADPVTGAATRVSDGTWVAWSPS